MAGKPPQNKKNIVLLISDMQGGGAQRVASILCNAWAGRGDAVTLVTFEPETAAPFYTLDPAIRLFRLDLQTRSTNFFKALWSNAKRIIRFRKILAATRPDTVLGFAYDAAIIGVLAAAGLGVKVIACERTDPSLYPTGIWRVLRNILYPRAHKIVVQTPQAAEFCRRFHKDVTIIPNPVERPDTSAAPDIALPPRRFISSLGRMSAEKGHDILIDAFALVAASHTDVDLLLIGDGPLREAYEKRAAGLGMQGRVHFAGRAKNPFPVLEKAEIFILPSRFEGFPNALAEAMALGLPCIATQDPIGVRALIRHGENGLLVKGDDPAAMAASIERLLTDRPLAQALGARAAGITESLSLRNILSAWDENLTASS